MHFDPAAAVSRCLSKVEATLSRYIGTTLRVSIFQQPRQLPSLTSSAVLLRCPPCLQVLLLHCIQPQTSHICLSLAFKYKRLNIDDAALLVVDLQVGLFQLVHDLEPRAYRTNVLAFSALGKYFGLPSVLTTSAETGPNGPLPQQLIDDHPGAPYIKRQGEVNAWDNADFRDAVNALGKKQLIIAGITTEVCVAFLALCECCCFVCASYLTLVADAALREAGYDVSSDPARRPESCSQIAGLGSRRGERHVRQADGGACAAAHAARRRPAHVHLRRGVRAHARLAHRARRSRGRPGLLQRVVTQLPGARPRLSRGGGECAGLSRRGTMHRVLVA